MQRFRFVLPLIVSSVCVAGNAEARQTSADTKERLEEAAKGLSHFATADLIYNRWSEPSRWPVGMLEAQQGLFQQLRALAQDRDGLRGLLQDQDPTVRALTLGALFIREDPQDLPFIARLMSDATPTIPRLGMSLDSRGGRLPLSMFESSQTVGGIAQEMIRFYLHATDRPSFQVQSISFPRRPEIVPSLFDSYWSERSGRARCASWFVVRMRRATRQTTPLQPQYEEDVRRVLAEIDALPAVERAWTLLWVRTDQRQIDKIVSDAALVTALQVVGPDGFMTFLRREPPIDDPDLLAGSVYSGSRTGFILDHAPQLLRASDADSVVAAAEAYRTLDNNTRFVAAAARLRALENLERTAASIKAEIGRIPIGRTLGLRDQATLAFTLWQTRGADERTFLVDWFYTVLPFRTSPDWLEYFLRDVEKEARPDTPLLLRAIVDDLRFEQADWSPLERLLVMVNQTVASPLVDPAVIYNYRPSSQRPDQQTTLATWRRLLRQHFGLAQ
jgi:hypothetical protein